MRYANINVFFKHIFEKKIIQTSYKNYIIHKLIEISIKQYYRLT